MIQKAFKGYIRHNIYFFICASTYLKKNIERITKITLFELNFSGCKMVIEA